jgi:hypothetical protein
VWGGGQYVFDIFVACDIMYLMEGVMKKKLLTAKNEKDVENIYRAALTAAIKDAKITSPYGSDGLLEAPDLRTLLEFKYDEAMKNKLDQCNVLIQVLYYLKKFENAGERLPSTIFVGDVNECFALKTNNVVKYLDHKIDWTLAPSTANKHNVELLQAMVDDIDILPFVYDVDERFDIKDVIQKIKDLSENVVRKVKVTEKNIETIFEYFNKNVLGDKVKLTTNERANLFIQIMINPEENYLHPQGKKMILVTKGFGSIAINRELFRSFFSHFDGEKYSPKEKEKFTGFVDRLVEDTTRRRKGEFFTPTLFVDEAHKYIAKAFGEDWKDEYVVWDCAAGTGNLTRDYKFKELYISTLEQSDIDTMNQMGYNPEAVKFQYDFLNDGVGEDMFDESAMPEGLVEAIESGKKVLFFINPPYATANNAGTKDGDHKAGVAKTKMGEEMKAAGWGACAQNLYAQFLYRIWKFKRLNPSVCIAIFCPPLFLSGGSYKAFREKFLDAFGYENGFLFQASHFSDVAQNWGIGFTLWGKSNNKIVFEHNLVDVNEFAIERHGEKSVYNMDKEYACSQWVREEIKSKKTFDAPQIASATKIKQDGRGRSIEKHIGYFGSNGNSVYDNPSYVFLLSECSSRANGLSVVPENFHKVTTLFAARRMIQPDWMNCKDEYLAPNESHPAWNQFVTDSIVYSLFNNSSQQSGLRRIDYKGKQWDIKNEFFWLSSKEIAELADEASYDNLYKDAKTASERFVYKKLFEEGIYDKLSPDAKAVLDAATGLLKKSIKMRAIMSDAHPEYHLDSFDAGYAQLKLVWKEYFKDEFEAFRKLYKDFEDRLRPLVYELGFLKK